MNIKFKLETQGSLVSNFLIDKKVIRIKHSDDYGDKFQELLNQLFLIYELVKNNDKNYFPISINTLWEDDSIQYKWEVKLNSLYSKLEIRVIELYPKNPDLTVLLINQEVEFENFFNDIYLSLNEMFLNFGLIGYKKVWGAGNFPIYEYLILKAEKNRFKINQIKYDIEDEEWHKKVSIKDEIKIINL